MGRAIQRSGRANGSRGEYLTVCPYASTTGPSLLGNNHHGAVHPVHIHSFCFFMRREMTTRARVGDRCARYRPSHEISPLVVQSTPSIRLDSSSKAFSRASIRSCSTHAARSISASHASWISRRPSGRVRYRYLDVTSARHPNNNRNTATTGIIVGPSSACLTSGLIKRLYGPILTTPHQTKWRGVAPTTRSARTQFLRRKTGDAKP